MELVPVVTPAGDAKVLEREARESLRSALVETEPRARHRARLERAIELSQHALAAAADERTILRARETLAKACAARADDARHGVNQLSLSAQRAPTCEGCEDGWRQAAAIAAEAASFACNAADLEAEPSSSAVARAAQQAKLAARDAQRILDERNYAFTFHADRGFSFGEGWYIAAAGVLAGAAIQIEPGKSASMQAERFLRDAGLADQLQPYRARPRAPKQATELVGQAFRADPMAAQRKLRAAFLGDAPIARSLIDWVEEKLARAPTTKKVLVWVRSGVHHPNRNTTFTEVLDLVRYIESAGLVPVLTGEAASDELRREGIVDLTLFRLDPIFQGEDARRAQLQLFECLKSMHGLVGQLGVTTAGMDGPALMGLPTMYLTDEPNVRMREWVGAVPGYVEVVRDNGYLEGVCTTLAAWAATPRAVCRP
jgi:hypothetical protein